MLTADGHVQQPLAATAAGFVAPNYLPADRVRKPEEMVGPAIVSHDQSWRQILFPNLYAYDKTELAEAEAEALARQKRELEKAARKKVGLVGREIDRDSKCAVSSFPSIHPLTLTFLPICHRMKS